MIKIVGLLAMIMALLASVSIVNAQTHCTQRVEPYIFNKLNRYDIVFMGTLHQQPAILRQTAELIPHLRERGVTHLALEITSDQQPLLDRFMVSGSGLARIALHKAIDCPLYRNLLTMVSQLPPGQRLKVVAIDLPAGRYDGPTSRNEHMAVELSAVFHSHPRAKILALLGSLHVLRKLNWQRRIQNGHDAVRGYLEQRHPGLRMFSVVHLVESMEGVCDFTRHLGPLPGTVALDVDHRFKGWRLGLTDCLAVRPSQPYELVDGVIVY